MSLHVIDPEPNQTVIAVLEEILERARSGEAIQVAIATVYRDGSIGHSWSNGSEFPRMLGAVNRLAWALNNDQPIL